MQATAALHAGLPAPELCEASLEPPLLTPAPAGLLPGQQLSSQQLLRGLLGGGILSLIFPGPYVLSLLVAHLPGCLPPGPNCTSPLTPAYTGALVSVCQLSGP